MSLATLPEISGRNWRVIVGDVLDGLRTLPESSVQCCVTSPPYWGLRAYGTNPQIWGGDASCEHEWDHRRWYSERSAGGSSAEAFHEAGPDNAERLKKARWREDDTCRKCGAWRGELGSEPTVDLFVANIVAVFQEVRRVLRPDGLLWINMGDSYASGKGSCFNPGGGARSLGKDRKAAGAHPLNRGNKSDLARIGLKPKDLIGVPWRIAFALQADGWYLRSEIIWHKRSCMPESVTDRPTKAHEQIFLLTKAPRYFYDCEAVKEPSSPATHARQSQNLAAQAGSTRANGGTRADRPMKSVSAGSTRKLAEAGSGTKNNGSFDAAMAVMPADRNLRSVWSLSSEGFSEAHFATFPSELPRRCIKAGTSERGCCPKCLAPWRRVTERTKRTRERPNELTKRNGSAGTGNHCANTVAGVAVETRGWEPTCKCGIAETIPCTVLDCFSGSGTTGMAATELGRCYIGCELNPEYAEMSRKRIESWKYRDVAKQPEPLKGQQELFD